MEIVIRAGRPTRPHAPALPHSTSPPLPPPGSLPELSCSPGPPPVLHCVAVDVPYRYRYGKKPHAGRRVGPTPMQVGRVGRVGWICGLVGRATTYVGDDVGSIPTCGALEVWQ